MTTQKRSATELFHNPMKHPQAAAQQGFKYMFGVYRYDEDCKNICKSSVETQPYLHCAVLIQRQDNGRYTFAYMVYIWDVRKALYKHETVISEQDAINLRSLIRSSELMQARDNLNKVEGQPSCFNYYMSRTKQSV